MFKLQDEKTLSVVLRRISQILSTNEIKQNPMEVEIEAPSVPRMHKINPTRIYMPLVLVLLVNTAKNRNI